VGANLGLGLYEVRAIATAHGATVEVTSDASATEFTQRSLGSPPTMGVLLRSSWINALTCAPSTLEQLRVFSMYSRFRSAAAPHL